jgi:hypothetical protein
MCVFVDRKDEEVWFVVCCNSKANDVRTASTYGTLCSKRVAKLVKGGTSVSFYLGRVLP